jgi:hypothetical protein
MARKIIDIGTIGNDGTGDSIRDSFRKVNDNFRELYSSLGLGERLTFIGLDDTPSTYVGQLDENDPSRNTPIVSINNTGDGLDFKKLVEGNGISIDFTTNPNEIVINSDFASIAADPSPQLGGPLNVFSGGLRYPIGGLPNLNSLSEYQSAISNLNINYGSSGDANNPDRLAVNKGYADSKISRAGVAAINPATGQPEPSFGRMTGPLILSRDPEPDDDELYGGLVAATKRYVDNSAFGSSVNLYVALSGEDDRPGVSKTLQGRALAYAYRTLEAALKRAEEIILESPIEIGPYKKVLTFNDGAGTCTLTSITTSPTSGVGFSGAVRMSVDAATLNVIGTNYYPGDILKIDGGTLSTTGAEALIEVLTTNTVPGNILTFRIISSGSYTVLPGSTNIATIIVTSAAPPGTPRTNTARFNLTYRVNSVSIISGGSGYSLVSVRITGGGGAGAFGTAVVSLGSVTSITITDRGSGFTSIPTLTVDLPRFAIRTDNFRTDFTGDVINDTPQAIRGRDIREGLFLRGETSGALAQILAHDGSLDLSGNELFDVDIKFGAFQTGEVISYGDITKNVQITVLVESGEYYENYPLRVPQNTSIVGDEFRRVIFRPRPGVSSSPWAFQKFRRDLVIDGLNTANKLYGYHYLTDPDEPVYPKINNKGDYTSAAALLDLNRTFIQEEIIAWMNYNIVTATPSSVWKDFSYDENLYKKDFGLIVDAIVFDLKYNGYNRTISAALKYYQNQRSPAELTQYLLVLDKLNSLMQSVIINSEITPVYQTVFNQIIDPAFQSEVGSSSVITALIQAIEDIINESGPGYGSVNQPKNNEELDVFLANDAVRWQAVSAQGHGGFMLVLDPEGQILAKSPYAQECASFSRSKDRQVFAGGMFADGFSGNLQFKHVATDISNTRLSVEGLERFPQLPASFLVDDTVFRINYVRDFVFNPAGSTATFVLDETTPFTRTPGSQICTIGVGSPAVITNTDHRLQAGSTIVFTNTGGSLPTGIQAGREYYVTEDGLTNNTFNITATFGSITKVNTSGSTSGTNRYQRIYEVLMPGNRSMLANDYTQINDLGYGAVAMNGGLMELVSVFTYYCHISYYSLNGGQIRSVGGSSAHGNFALVAEGFDPLEVPTPTTVFEDLAQKVKCYFPSPSFENTVGGLFIYIYAYDYIPNSVSELEVDHGGIIFRYPVTSVTVEDTLPPGVARLNLTTGSGAVESEGLFAVIPNNTLMTLRSNGQILLTGDLGEVAVRPSTGLKLRETGDTVYRVLQFTPVEDLNGPYPVSITNASPTVIKMLVTITDITDNLCTTAQNHKLRLGDKFIPTSSDNGFTSGTTYYIIDVPEYNQFKVSTSPTGTETTLVNGSVTIQGVKTHKLLENYTISFNSTVSLPTGIIADQVYFVLPDGLTDVEFRISETQNGLPVNTSSAGSGSFAVRHRGITKTTLRENYDYVEYTVRQPGETATYNLVATDTEVSTNLITLSTISYQVKPGMPIVFSGTTFGGITAGVTYYVFSSPYSDSIPIANVTRVSDTATIVTSVNHGLANGQVVNINSTGTALDSDNAVSITVIDLTTFSYTSGGTGGIGPVVATSGRVISDNKISISATPGSSALTLSTASGTMNAVAGGPVTATISVGVPGVVTANAHGFQAGDVFKFITTGELPIGVNSLTHYHVLSTGLTTNSFRFSTSPNGVAIDTGAGQTGTHSITRVRGRAGDSFWTIIPVAVQLRSRVVGSKFMFIGEEYVVTQYDSEEVTNEGFARIYINKPLRNSIVAYNSSYTAKGAVPIRSNGSLGNLTIRISLTRVTSHDLLEIGTGSYADTNYPKEIYGQSVNPVNESTEVAERDVGRVFYVTTDQFGNFKVGPFFRVDQGTGTVTFSASIALSNLDGIGFKRGVPVSEFSTDSAFTDNATDTVPTENATRVYIERRLGVSHDGATVDPGQVIPSVTGGFMALTGQLGMKGSMNLNNNKIVNVNDPTDPQDAVNLRSLTWNNFQNFSGNNVDAADILVFTGSGNSSVNATIVGDVTFELRPGVDSTLNQIDVQYVPGSILNADVNNSADIAQSKLLMTLASTRAAAPTGTARDKQAANGIASFDSSVFDVVDGFVTVKNNGLVLVDLPQIASKNVLGNAGLTIGNVTEVPYTSVVNEGGAIKKNQYSTTGFLRRVNTGSSSADVDYTVVEAAAGTAAAPEVSKLIIRDSNGDFGARVADLSQLKIDNIVTIDSGTSATGGFIRYTGFNGSGGLIVSNGSLGTDRITFYDNDAHQFRTQNGLSLAPISASSIQVTSLTTGGNTTAGTITGRWTLTGTSPNESRLQATYSADLAEYYEGDKEYPVGTVLVFGGDKEVTISNKHFDTRVAGVVSNTAAFVMYDACPGHKNLVALQGRVPCRVVGKIQKGDLLVTSNIAGVAISAQENAQVGTVVGKALVNYDSDHIGTIEIAVGRT